ncbi:MAG TPA: MarR family EPS-associated transcriptional regulator [Burkholderiales bacterium]|nr:MarR family EPS-associated transcriptional regulator [Burkholderiales bacterium]
MLDETTRYRLLKLLESNPEVSQRQVAEALGISVGKTNFCLRALLDRGLVKVRNFRDSQNKMAYAYYLTPKGAQEKVRTTALFLQRRLKEYQEIEREIEQLKREVRSDGIH